jgi:hypothetical protein
LALILIQSSRSPRALSRTQRLDPGCRALTLHGVTVKINGVKKTEYYLRRCGGEPGRGKTQSGADYYAKTAASQLKQPTLASDRV